MSSPFLETLRREWRITRDYGNTLHRLSMLRPNSPDTVADLVEQQAKKHPNHVAIYFEDRQVTYREYDIMANRFANWARSQGLKRGDTVALLMHDRPEFLFAWLGMAKIGVITALLNDHLHGHSLAHCLNIVDAKYLILDSTLADDWHAAANLLESPIQVWSFGGLVKGAKSLNAALDKQSAQLPAGLRAGMKSRETCLYIYTSGTTGLPKAAKISHFRFLSMAYGAAALLHARASDRMYQVLPLHHSAGGIMGVGGMLAVGASIVIKQKFSVHEFWSDCLRYQVTLFQYIGELCRYLLNAPPHPAENAHTLRAVIGNGLRPDIWKDFQRRFNIPRIVEFYGATEGNVFLVNLDGKVGAVGRLPVHLKSFSPIRIVKFDTKTETPIRNARGYCVECGINETGEMLGRITNFNLGVGRFEGYTDVKATEGKVLRNVFRQGDAWFRTGDLLKKDHWGYIYFMDRTGDTYRWKGENIATSEVAEILSDYPGVREANVYGVHVPNTEGRAGMAALVLDNNIDMDRLYDYLKHELAIYAIPLFLRIQHEIKITDTFKHRKVELVEAGFDPAKIKEPLYFADHSADAFVALDDSLYAKIQRGCVRL